MLQDVVAKIKALEIYEERTMTETYCEVVFKTSDQDKWAAVLTEFLGQPAKPSGQKPSSEDMKITKDFSGIYANQTLYKKEVDGSTVIAMLWPWGSGDLITLKLAVLGR
jgi:hypothetical protein